MSMTLCNGAVLPDIPTDVLTKYPYAVVVAIKLSDVTAYLAVVSEKEYGFFKSGIIGESQTNDMIISLGAGADYEITEDGNSWTKGADLAADGDNTCRIGEVNVSESDTATVTIIWSNHDILEVTAVDTNTGEVTTGNIYFTEYQELNSVWFPKIPKDFENSYPYEIIVKMELMYTDEYKEAYPNLSNQVQYVLILGPAKFVYSYDSAEGMYQIHQKKFLGVYGYTVDSYTDPLINKWLHPNETLNDTDGYLPIFTYSTTNSTVSCSLHWTNHDVHVCNVAEDGTITETDEIYMSGTGVVEPPEKFSIARESLTFVARRARQLNEELNPLSIDEVINTFAELEAFEDAERMVF